MGKNSSTNKVSCQNVEHCSAMMLLSYRLLDDVETGGADTRGHGMVLALHLLKQLKSSHKFSELLTEKYESICHWLNCLQPFHKQFAVCTVSVCVFICTIQSKEEITLPQGPLAPKPNLSKEPKPQVHLLPFMLPNAEKTELSALYLQVRSVMVGEQAPKEKLENLICIANEW